MWPELLQSYRELDSYPWRKIVGVPPVPMDEVAAAMHEKFDTHIIRSEN